MKKFLVIALVFLILSNVCACQATPEKGIVISKGDGELEKIISESAVPQSQYHAEDNWSDTISSSNVTININAKVNIPEAESFPVFEVINTHFTQEIADTAINALFGNSDLSNYVELSKASIEAQLISLRKYENELKEGNIPADVNNSIEDELQMVQAEIEELESLYADAPETNLSNSDVNIQLVDTEYGTGLDLVGSIDGNNATLYIMNNTEDSIEVTPGSRLNFSKDFDLLLDIKETAYTDQELAISFSEAEAKAQSFLQELGIEDTYITNVSIKNYLKADSESQTFAFEITRSFNSIPFTVIGAASEGISDESAEQDTYRKPFNTEVIRISIGADGIEEFSWENPIEILNQQSENVALMNFDNIKERAIEQLGISNYGFATAESTTIDIHTVILGYYAIPMLDKDTYRLIPVWDFIGRYVEYQDLGNYSFLTLNAVDGSNVERVLS